MTSLRMGPIVILGLCLCSLGCQGGLRAENDELRRQNQELSRRLADSERLMQSTPEQMAAMQRQIAEREQRIRELEAQLRSPEPGVSAPGIEGIQTSYDRARGELTVNLPADILFEPGSAELKATSRATLNKIADALRSEYRGKPIRVEGHTDTDPIVKSQWKDNLELSQQRAAAVTRYLVQRGIELKNIATTGFADSRPKPTKAASRRVEIVVVTG
jgi:flagellar motor protein MotB